MDCISVLDVSFLSAPLEAPEGPGCGPLLSESPTLMTGAHQMCARDCVAA